MSGEGYIALQVGERAGIGRIAFNAVVQGSVVGAAGVNRVAIIEGVAASALLDLFEDVSDQNDGASEVFVVVNVELFAHGGRRLRLRLNTIKNGF
jgi:hypothetical protein